MDEMRKKTCRETSEGDRKGTAADRLDEDLRVANLARTQAVLWRASLHRLRGPLNTLNLELDLLSHSLRDERLGAEERLEHVERIRKELRRLDEMLPAALSIRGLEPEAREPHDLVRLVHDLLDECRHESLVRGVRIERELPSGPVVVTGRRSRLAQAILNVLLNACEVTREGGRIGLELHTEKSQAVVSIEDEGPGIPESIAPQIFDAHFTTRDDHSGIGLHVTRHLVEEHGGRIALQPLPSGGTIVEIFLPLSPRA
jgi:signal transduction histidine kinase